MLQSSKTEIVWHWDDVKKTSGYSETDVLNMRLLRSSLWHTEALNWNQFLCSSNRLVWEHGKSLKTPKEKRIFTWALWFQWMWVTLGPIWASVRFFLAENNSNMFTCLFYGDILDGCFRNKGLNSG